MKHTTPEDVIYIPVSRKLNNDLIRFSDGAFDATIVGDLILRFIEDSFWNNPVDYWGDRAEEVAEIYAPHVAKQWQEEDDRERADRQRCNKPPVLPAVRNDEEDGVAMVIDRLARFHISPPPRDYGPNPRLEPEPTFQPPWGKYRYQFLGEEGAADTLGALTADILRRIAALYPDFLDKYSQRRGRTRRFIARDPKAIYAGREDLSHLTTEVCRGWWVGTNYGRVDVRRLLHAACEVAGLAWAVDLIVEI